ncbi:unnamed protein product [Amoebophrya sp. A120]|nr:unnamed protein product [Amoebophrya sp. A120]|eukprot:GSA120T00011802001.1
MAQPSRRSSTLRLLLHFVPPLCSPLLVHCFSLQAARHFVTPPVLRGAFRPKATIRQAAPAGITLSNARPAEGETQTSLPGLHSRRQLPDRSATSRLFSRLSGIPHTTSTSRHTLASCPSRGYAGDVADSTMAAPSAMPTSQQHDQAAPSTDRVAFLGLGRMGAPMAANIHKKWSASRGGKLAVWNRSTEKAEQHAAAHGSVMISDLASELRCPIVFCCLPTSDQVRTIAEKLVEAKKGSDAEDRDATCDEKAARQDQPHILVDCTSGSRAKTIEIGRYLAEHGIALVDCPVSGGPAGAEAGSLSAMLGGEPADVERVLPIVKTFAAKTQHVGPLGSGHAVKSVNNLLNSLHLMAATEGLLALKKIGIDPTKALECINTSSGRSLQTEQRIPKEVLTGNFNYGFALNLMQKDCRLARELVASLCDDAWKTQQKETCDRHTYGDSKKILPVDHEDLEDESPTSTGGKAAKAQLCSTDAFDVTNSLLLHAADRVDAIADHYGATKKGGATDADYTMLSKYFEEKLRLTLRKDDPATE